MEVRRPSGLQPKKPATAPTQHSLPLGVRETSAPFIDVRGHQAYSEAASPLSRAGALAVDSSIGLLALAFAQATFKTGVPVPSNSWVLISLALGLLVWAVFRASFARSLGELIWRIQPKIHAFNQRLTPTGFQPSGFGPREIVISSAATGAILLASIAGSYALLSTHRGWMIADDWDLKQSGASLTSDKWIVTPFYYAMGAWPRMFADKPIFYSLPYAKGPPELFVGQIVARWDAPDIRVIFEGPKTPPQLAGGYDPRDMIRRCLTSRAGDGIGVARCARIRAAALDRHIREMGPIAQRELSIRWLSVRNPAIQAKDEVQGIYLSARGVRRAQDRFVLLLPNGTHQAIFLDYPTSQNGDDAKALFVESLKSLRASPELAHGKRWVDSRIGTFKLDELRTIADPAILVQRIAEIQTILISKISVDPRTYDSYFHLAGTASLLAGYAIKEKRDDWAAVSKPLIQALFQYSRDIAPADPRTAQIENLWLQIKRN